MRETKLDAIENKVRGIEKQIFENFTIQWKLVMNIRITLGPEILIVIASVTWK